MTPGFGAGLVIPDLWQQEAIRAWQQGKRSARFNVCFACDETARLLQLKLMRAYEIRSPTDKHGVDRIFY
jgi:hypothetical protein